MEKYLRNSIKNFLIKNDKKIVIYPYGKYGKMTKEILNNEYGIQEKYVVDNLLYKEYSFIKSVDELRKDYEENDDFVILIVVDYKTNANIIVHQQIMDFASVDRIMDVLSPSLYFCDWNYYNKFFHEKNIKHYVTECLQREIYVNGVQGAIAEAGVYKGETAKRINYLFPDRKLYLFDTFEGFDTRDLYEENINNRYNMKVDFSDTTVEEVMSYMLFPRNCIVKKGRFPESAEGIEERFAFVRLDMDLYEPIKAGLEFFYPRMAKGGYIAIHDCRSKNFDGAREALIDFCTMNHIGYVNMWDDLGTAVISVAL